MAEPDPPPQQPVVKLVLCPYCGARSRQGERCEHCRGGFDPLSRQASQNEMGPWSIRDESRPFQPGCSFAKLKSLIERGRVGPDTIVRGPTTNQFWQPASQTPSVANLLGRCHACGGEVAPADFACRHCGAAFTPIGDRQHLGLGPTRLLPGSASPSQIAASTGFVDGPGRG